MLVGRAGKNGGGRPAIPEGGTKLEKPDLGTKIEKGEDGRSEMRKRKTASVKRKGRVYHHSPRAR